MNAALPDGGEALSGITSNRGSFELERLAQIAAANQRHYRLPDRHVICPSRVSSP